MHWNSQAKRKNWLLNVDDQGRCRVHQAIHDNMQHNPEFIHLINKYKDDAKKREDAKIRADLRAAVAAQQVLVAEHDALAAEHDQVRDELEKLFEDYVEVIEHMMASPAAAPVVEQYFDAMEEE